MINLKLLFSKKARLAHANTLAEQSGVLVGENPVISSQSAVLMLAFKALIVFCTLMGSLHCYMSGFGIAYNFDLMLCVCAVISLVFTLANTGIVYTALVYAAVIYYISLVLAENQGVCISGAIAMVNLSYNLISKKYKLPSVDGFEEPIPDRQYTVTAFLILGAVVAGLILAFLICRFMNVALVLILTMLPLGIVLFFGGEPSATAFFMLVAAWFITAIAKFSWKFATPSLKRKMATYYYDDVIYARQKCDGTAMVQGAALVVAICLCIGLLGAAVVNRELFDSKVLESRLKKSVDYTVRDTMIIAFSNYKRFNISPTAVGGQLGFYGNSQPDFETDLKVRLVPYTTDRIYFKSYTGSSYGYMANQWFNVDMDKTYKDSSELSALGRAVKAKGVKASAEIENVALANAPAFMPYYTVLEENESLEYVSDDIVMGSLPVGQVEKASFYPYTEGLGNVDSSEYRDYVYSTYLAVPKQLTPRLKSLCSGHGLKAGDEQLTHKMNQYFQNNFRYDMQSGRLPWRTDFVEYFLFETKAGVCAHFATAATLMYRSLGIPARYVEGYCADYGQFVTGKPVEGADPADWLTGLRPLSPYVMEAELSDYNAHAWVEVYKDGIGWVTVDPTPYCDIEELKKETIKADTLEELLNYFGTVNFLDAKDGSLGKIPKGFLMAVAALAVVFFAYLFVLRGLITRLLALIMARGSQKAMAGLYFNHVKTLGVYAGLMQQNDFYRETCKNLESLGFDHSEAYLYLTEKAIYSKNGLDNKEFAKLKGCYRAAKKVVLRSMPWYKRPAAVFKYWCAVENKKSRT